MLTIEQIKTIHTNAQALFAGCQADMLEHVLSILEVTSLVVYSQVNSTWTQELDGSHTLTFQGTKMGRVYPVTHNGHDVYKGVVLHTYDPASDSDETFVCNNGFLEYAKREVLETVQSILKTREQGVLIHG